MKRILLATAAASVLAIAAPASAEKLTCQDLETVFLNEPPRLIIVAYQSDDSEWPKDRVRIENVDVGTRCQSGTLTVTFDRVNEKAAPVIMIPIGVTIETQ